MHQIILILNPAAAAVIDLGGVREYSSAYREGEISGESKMAKYLQCSECGKLAFYYDECVGPEKPCYKRFMRYP
ncbi:MAG: hypothetical protein ACXW4Z_15580, partial [Candidatus Binatia bacterium]